MMTTSTPPSSYWQTEKTLSECFDYMLTSGTASDVTFLVGEDKERIAAHKLVLISRSPVFYAMFVGPLAEKGDVTIPDITDDIFLLFLRYLYTDTIDLTKENAVPVLSAARKYGVDILVSHCEKFLNKTFSEHNVCHILEHAHMFMLDNLQKDCLRWIDKHPKTILHSTFADLCRGCMTSITGSEDLLTDERDVYTAVVNWAEAECKRQQLDITPDNKRNVLGDVLYTVRFPVMDNDVFQRKVCHDQLVSAEEVVQTINYQLHHVKVSGSKLKYTERRSNMTKRLWRVEGIVESEWDMGTETMSFSVSGNLNLVGFGSFYSRGDNTLNVVIYEGTNVIYKADGISRAKGESDDIGEVLLTGRDRIQLKPDKVYTIGEHTDYKRKCHGRLVSTEQLRFKNTDITFRNSDVRFSNTLGHNRRQIPYLLLKSDFH